jgi:hypothetical protein
MSLPPAVSGDPRTLRLQRRNETKENNEVMQKVSYGFLIAGFSHIHQSLMTSFAKWVRECSPVDSSFHEYIKSVLQEPCCDCCQTFLKKAFDIIPYAKVDVLERNSIVKAMVTSGNYEVVKKHVMSVLKRAPTCVTVQTVILYLIVHDHLPLQEEFSDLCITLNNGLLPVRDGLCNAEKLDTSVFTVSDEQHKCCLCQTDITLGQIFYKLPCGHFFHQEIPNYCNGLLFWFRDTRPPALFADNM